jgi:hypothetical protein
MCANPVIILFVNAVVLGVWGGIAVLELGEGLNLSTPHSGCRHRRLDRRSEITTRRKLVPAKSSIHPLN